MPLLSTSVTITVNNHTEWMGKEVEGILDASILHNDLLLLAGDGGRFPTHRALLLASCTHLAQLCSIEREEDVVHLPLTASSTIRCLLHLVYHGKCTLVKSEVGELLILASALGLHLSPQSLHLSLQSLNLDPVLPQAALEESGVKDKQENPCNSQGFLGVEEIKEESDSPKAADLRNCMLAMKDQDPPVDKAKIEAHKKLLRSLFQGSFKEGYTCISCGKHMGSMASILAHCEGHLNISIPCTICPRICKTRGGLYYHMTKVHKLKTFSRYSSDVQYNLAEVINTEGMRLDNSNNQDSVVQDLEGALDDVLQKVKVEADEEVSCANKEKVVKTEGTLKYYDAGEVDMVDLKEKSKVDAGDKSDMLGFEVDDNADARDRSALVKSSQPEQLHRALKLHRGIKRKLEDLEKEEGEVFEREGMSKKMLKGDNVRITDRDTSEDVEICKGDHAGKTRPKLLDLNPFLICNICKGYLVSATTITNCLHSFCKSCLVKQMVDKNSPLDHCPTCQGPIEGFNGLREDRQLQAIVNQVIPDLEVKEEERRKKFYDENPKGIHQEEEDGVFDS